MLQGIFSFSLSCDETTDITNTAQLAVFVRGITAEFDTREKLLSLEVMHGTTTGEDLFQETCFINGKISTDI